MNLLDPPKSYVDYIEHSAHYLTPPKTKFNEDLDSLYRQGIHNNTSIENITNFLKQFKVKNAEILAEKFVEQRRKISLQEFEKINSKSYDLHNLPKHIKNFNDTVNNFFKTHKNYHWNGVYAGTDSYPFRKL